MGVFFGEDYIKCFQDVINVLFDNNDVLQEYDDVYIQTKLEMAISDFFNGTFKERVSCNYPEHSMKSTESCAQLLQRYLQDEMHYGRRFGPSDSNWEIFPHPKYYSEEGIRVRIFFSMNPNTKKMPFYSAAVIVRTFWRFIVYLIDSKPLLVRFTVR